MNDIQPLVSIGVPTYNRPEELRRSLEGLITQTYWNLEIIVSDNATPNGLTDEVLHAFMQRDSRIKYFQQLENRGALFNFQFVMDKATGEYFMWAADDDYRTPTYVEMLVEQMRYCPDCSISFCDFAEVDENGVQAEGYPHHLPLLRPFTSRCRLIRLIRFFFQLESKGKANLIYGLMRRESLRGFKWSEFVGKHGEYGADMLFVFVLLCKGRLVLTDQRLYQCTVGNKKDYIVTDPLSFSEKLASPLIGLVKQLRYSVQYPLIARGLVRMAILICWPIKAADIIVRIFLATEIKNIYNRVQRRIPRVETS